MAFTLGAAAGEGRFWSISNQKSKKWTINTHQTLNDIMGIALEGQDFESFVPKIKSIDVDQNL